MNQHLDVAEQWSQAPQTSTDFYAHSNISVYEISATPQRAMHLPVHPGSMLRGAFGHALLDRYCLCSDTAEHDPSCIYQHLFEGQRADSQDGIPALVISPVDAGRTLQHGELFRFRLTLIGLSDILAQAVLSALNTALARGLGDKQVPCHVHSIRSVLSQVNLAYRGVRVSLTTPWLVKHRGKQLNADQLRLHDVIIALAQRQRKVARHFGLSFDLPDNHTLLALADRLPCTVSLREVSWLRQSSRQGRKHPLRGVMGFMETGRIGQEDADILGSVLANGVALHGGGKTSFGLGGLAVSSL
ncbi:hypothetical protein [Marinobacterium stanieri]|uniref:hypothetical protein n=1 Tax=Marinobacterium stanieri TaxID=49186 RepID=UPI003A956593